LLENKAKPQAMMNLLQFIFQSLPVRGEGAAPEIMLGLIKVH
jgi:hypothetical protein